jgi:RHS repeat-associated protein
MHIESSARKYLAKMKHLPVATFAAIAIALVSGSVKAQSLADILSSIQERQLLQEQKTALPEYLLDVAGGGETGGYAGPTLIEWDSLPDFPVESDTTGLTMEQRLGLLNKAVKEFDKLKTTYLNVSSQRLDEATTSGGIELGVFRGYTEYDLPSPGFVTPENYRQKLRELAIKTSKLRVVSWPVLGDMSYIYGSKTINKSEPGHQPTTINIADLNQQVHVSANKSLLQDSEGWGEYAEVIGSYVFDQYDPANPNDDLKRTKLTARINVTKELTYREAPEGWTDKVAGNSYVVSRRRYSPASNVTVASESTANAAGTVSVLHKFTADADHVLHASIPGFSVTGTWADRSTSLSYDEWRNFVPTGCSLADTESDENYSEIYDISPGADTEWLVFRRDYSMVFSAAFSRGLDETGNGVLQLFDTLPPAAPADGTLSVTPDPGLLFTIDLGIGSRGATAAGLGVYHPGHDDRRDTPEIQDREAMRTDGRLGSPITTTEPLTYGVGYPSLSSDLRFLGSEEDFVVFYEGGRSDPPAWDYPVTDKRKGWFAANFAVAWEEPRLRQIVGRTIIADISYQASRFATTIKLYRRLPSSALGALTSPVTVSGTPLATYEVGPNGALDAAGLPVSHFSLKISEPSVREWTFDPAGAGSEYDFHQYTIAWKEGTTVKKSRSMVADDDAGTVVYTDTEGSVATANVTLDKGYVGFFVPPSLGPIYTVGPPANVLDPIFAVETVTQTSGAQNLVYQFTPDARYPTGLTITDPLHPVKSWQWLESGLPSQSNNGSWSTAYSVEAGELKAEQRYNGSRYGTTWTAWANNDEQETIYSAPDGSITSKTHSKCDSVVLKYCGASDTSAGAIPWEVKETTRKDLTGSTCQYNFGTGTLQIVTRTGAKSAGAVTRGREVDEHFNEIGLPGSLTVSEIGGVTLHSLQWGDLTSWGAPQKVVSNPQQMTTSWQYDGQRQRLASSQDVLGVQTTFGSRDVLDRLKSYTWNNHAGTLAYNSGGIGVNNTLTMTGLGNRGGSAAFDAFGNLNNITEQAGRPLDLTINRSAEQITATVDDPTTGRDFSSTTRQEDGTLASATGTILPFDGNTGTALTVDNENGLLVSTNRVTGQDATYQTTWFDAWGRVRKVEAPTTSSSGPPDTSNFVYGDPGNTVQNSLAIGASGRRLITETDPYSTSGSIRRSGIDVDPDGQLDASDRYVESTTRSVGGKLVTTLQLSENNGLREILRTETDPANGETVTKINGNEETITRTPNYTAKTVKTKSSKGWERNETFNNLGLTTNNTLSGSGVPSANLTPTWRDDGSLSGVTFTTGGDTHGATFDLDGTIASLTGPNGNIPVSHTISADGEVLIVAGVTTERSLDGTLLAVTGGDVPNKTEEIATSGTGYKYTTTPVGGATTEVASNAAGVPVAKNYAVDPVTGAGIFGESREYLPGGLLEKITLARSGDLILGYSPDGAKDLTSATWPQVTSGSPAVFTIPAIVLSYGHDRAGRVDEIGDSSGTRSLVYQSGRLKQTTWNSGQLAGYKVVRGLDDFGRDTGFELWRGNTMIHSAAKTFTGENSETNEVFSVTASGFSAILGRNGARSLESVTRGSVTQRWQRGTAGRILLADSNNTVIGAPAFDYKGTANDEDNAFDAKGRRLKVKTAGADWTYQYTNGQLTSASHPTLGSFSYQFDGIGRRKNYAGSGNWSDLLNQTLDWENSQNKTLKIAAHPDARVWLTVGADPTFEISGFTGSYEHPLPFPSGSGFWQAWDTLAVLEGEGDAGANADAKAEQSGAVWVPPVNESFEYDDAGNRESTALWDFGWNAKNELLRARTKNHNTAAQGYDITNAFDAEGRRFSKKVNRYQNGAIAEQKLITFLHDGDDIIYERHQLPSGLTLCERKYVWGPDISGTHGGAGGAGGLLLIRETKGNSTIDLYPLYDGTGHVVALADNTGTLQAEYAYGPFGENIYARGPHAQSCPFRYGTKYYDQEPGLYNFGLRFLDPITGQWLSREPLGERESLNLYSYCGNDAINYVDVRGLAPQWMTDAQGKEFDEHVREWLRTGNFSSNMSADIIRVMIDDGILPQANAAEEERLDAYYGTAGKVALNNPRYVSAGATLSSLAVGIIQTIPGTGPVGDGAGDGSNTTGALIFDTFRLNVNSLIALGNPGSGSISQEYASFLDGYNKKYSYGQRSFAQGASLAAAVLMPEAVMQGKAALANAPGWSVKLSPRLNPLNYRVAAGELYSGMPRLQFVKNGGISYGSLDSLGRPTGVTATISSDMIGTGSPALRSITPPGFRGGAAGQARGHLLGNQLGGSGSDIRNLVTLQQIPTNSPVMRGFENQIRAAVESGQVFKGSFVPVYSGADLVPRGITIMGQGSGDFRILVSILNPAGQ